MSLSVRNLANQAFSRAAGAPLVAGNSVRLLKDAKENYPAWLDAIKSAERYIHFESYIIHEDDAGWMFAEALSAKAREGVRVRIIYDWLGGLRQNLALVLESPSRRRRRSALLQPSAFGFTVRLGQSRSSQDTYRRRAGSVSLPDCAWAECGSACLKRTSNHGAIPESNAWTISGRHRNGIRESLGHDGRATSAR